MRYKLSMKNKLFFSYIITCITLHNLLETHEIQDQTDTLDELVLHTYTDDLFSSILDNGPLIDGACHLSPPRNAHAIKKNESILEKFRNIVIRCYAHMLCRYYNMQKWLSKCKQQSNSASHS